jgi:hypothetical protein
MAERECHNARTQSQRFVRFDPRPGLLALGCTNRKEARVPFALAARFSCGFQA